MTKTILFVLLGALGALFVVVWIQRLAKESRGVQGESGAPRWPSLYQTVVGFITDFFDTLGIGSFATTVTLWRARPSFDDRLIPGTLNVGHTLPTIAQAYIYIALIEVEMSTLVSMIVASVLGAWLGAGFVAKWPRRKVQLAMGTALLAAAMVIAVRQFQDSLLKGDTALGLHGGLLWIGLFGNFALGALMTMGIGLYAPCLVLVSLLGMSPSSGFPIMMGSCAFLMPVASMRFLSEGGCSMRAALGLALGGIPSVLIAAYLVKSLPLYWVQWLVVAVVIYTSIQMLRAARSGAQSS